VGLIGGAVLALAFLVCGVLALLLAPSRPGLLFGLAGVWLGVLLGPTPYFAAPGLRSLVLAVQFLVGLPAFACLLHFTLIFPEPGRILERKWVVPAIYSPAILLALASVIQIAQGGQAAPSIQLLSALASAVYLLLSIVALVRRYAISTPEVRAACGLRLLVWGMVLGFGPVAIEGVALLVAPGVVLPGSDYYFLAMVLIPLSFAAALLRQRASVPEGTAGSATAT